jgi:hypothetical protein
VPASAVGAPAGAGCNFIISSLRERAYGHDSFLPWPHTLSRFGRITLLMCTTNEAKVEWLCDQIFDVEENELTDR